MMKSFADAITDFTKFLGETIIAKYIGKYLLVPSLAMYVVLINSKLSMHGIGHLTMGILSVLGAMSYVYEFYKEPVKQEKVDINYSRVCSRFLSFVGIWGANIYLYIYEVSGKVSEVSGKVSVIYVALIIASSLPVIRLSSNETAKNIVGIVDNDKIIESRYFWFIAIFFFLLIYYVLWAL